MIDNIANTMKTLENIVIDYYSDSDNSEKLSERKQQRLETLKLKREDNAQKRRCGRNENRARENAQDVRKRGKDVNVVKQYDKLTTVKNYDTEAWYAHATKAVDSERERKRYNDNG